MDDNSPASPQSEPEGQVLGNLVAMYSRSTLIQPGVSPMNGNRVSRKVTVSDPLGLHMRPITRFVQRANEFASAVTVRKEDMIVNGKSSLDLLLLAAEQGCELVLEVCGSDAEDALTALADLLVAPWGEESIDEPLPKKG